MSSHETHAIRVQKVGGPEVLSWDTLPLSEPGPGEALVEHGAVGLNYIDVYYRTGLYAGPSAPFVLGMEGAGRVLAVGPGVTDVAPGDRVAYAGAMGAYAERRLVPADKLVHVPDGVSDEAAAACLLKGMTAQYLVRQIGALGPGKSVLVHAAAGGVGLLASQWAKHLGALVVGTVSTEEKAALARQNGCDEVVLLGREGFAAAARRATAGRGVDVVLDSIGKDTFAESLDALRPRGMFVSFGQSSGKVPPFDIGLLAAKGSLFLTRPSLMAYTATRAELVTCAGELFDVMERGAVRLTIGQRYALADAARAHTDLEARRTVGSTVLLP